MTFVADYVIDVFYLGHMRSAVCGLYSRYLPNFTLFFSSICTIMICGNDDDQTSLVNDASGLEITVYIG